MDRVYMYDNNNPHYYHFAGSWLKNSFFEMVDCYLCSVICSGRGIGELRFSSLEGDSRLNAPECGWGTQRLIGRSMIPPSSSATSSFLTEEKTRGL